MPQVNCLVCNQPVEDNLYVAHVQAHLAAGQLRGPQKPPEATPAPPQVQNAPVTAPPPPMPRNPYINAAMLYSNGGSFQAKIVSHRTSSGIRSRARPDIPDRGGWILELESTKPLAVIQQGPNGPMQVTTTRICGRVNIGDLRHQRLYAKFRENWVGQLITVRLPDQLKDGATRANWLVE